MIFTESARISNLLQIQFFCIVIVYIIQQIIEFLNIFLLLIGSHVREEVLRLNMVVAEFYKQIDQKSIMVSSAYSFLRKYSLRILARRSYTSS